MAIYECTVCGYIYDERKEKTRWLDLPEQWVCPLCDTEKRFFKLTKDEQGQNGEETESVKSTGKYLSEWLRPVDELENNMEYIHLMAETGRPIIEPMRTRRNCTNYWKDLLFRGSQLFKVPLNESENVNLKTIIGPKAKYPMVIESPVLVSHMSFGALSKEAKKSLAKGSAAVKTAICSGEGGILEDEMNEAFKYIFEYVPNKYSVEERFLKKIDAIEIKIGQSAKPGMGGHLPANKVTEEIAAVRGKKAGEDIISPAHFPGITTKEELKQCVGDLREITGGKPVGIKIAAGHIEKDLEIVLYAEPDFITVDGRPGGTGAAPKFIKESTSMPTLFALYRARKYLNENGGKDITLIITGGLRTASDFAKALAMGADAVAIATSALIALGCQQYRICDSGKCPIGITTQNPELRKHLKIEESSERLANFLNASSEELKNFARLTGSNDIHKLSSDDLMTTNSEISNYTNIEHV
jgi:glutamate synthase domain-containing protein 2